MDSGQIAQFESVLDGRSHAEPDDQGCCDRGAKEVINTLLSGPSPAARSERSAATPATGRATASARSKPFGTSASAPTSDRDAPGSNAPRGQGHHLGAHQWTGSLRPGPPRPAPARPRDRRTGRAYRLLPLAVRLLRASGYARVADRDPPAGLLGARLEFRGQGVGALGDASAQGEEDLGEPAPGVPSAAPPLRCSGPGVRSGYRLPGLGDILRLFHGGERRLPRPSFGAKRGAPGLSSRPLLPGIGTLSGRPFHGKPSLRTHHRRHAGTAEGASRVGGGHPDGDGPGPGSRGRARPVRRSRTSWLARDDARPGDARRLPWSARPGPRRAGAAPGRPGDAYPEDQDCLLTLSVLMAEPCAYAAVHDAVQYTEG